MKPCLVFPILGLGLGAGRGEEWGRDLFSAKGHLNIHKILPGPYKMIILKTSLLYVVKHLMSSLMPWQGQATWFHKL